ncbi:MAG: IS3-like element IS1141 family transposase, partial [Sciscionella sp.]
MIDTAIGQLSPLVGVKLACRAVGRARATHYRAHPVAPAPSTAAAVEPPARVSQPRALSSSERQAVLDVLHSERFV